MSDQGDEGVDRLDGAASELIEFVSHLDMGGFYAAQIKMILERRPDGYLMTLGGDPWQRARDLARIAERDREYLQQVRNAAGRVEVLVVELLDHQSWTIERQR